MNKIATLGAAVVIVVGVAAIGGAWYTGTRIEPLLNEQVANINQQLAPALAGQGLSANVALVSFERHVFSSEAHYVVTVQSPDLNGGAPAALNVAEHIEHGPFPWSRLKALDVLPVMASSQFTLQRSGELQPWFDLTHGAVPISGQATLGYDQAVNASLQVLPLRWADPRGTLAFSGLNAHVEGNAEGKKLQVTAALDHLDALLHGPEGDAHLQLQGVTLKSGGLKGQSGFYLGTSEVQAASGLLALPNEPAVALEGFLGVGSLEEIDGKLKGSTDYTLASLQVGGKPIGSLQMRWVIDRFDAAATQELITLYQNKLQPQAQAAAEAGVPFTPQLSPADQLLVQASALRLLAGQPHIALENVGLKTANGESHFSLALDLAKPADLNQPAEQLLQQMIQRLDAKLAVSTLSLKDLATVQGQLQGQTDAAILARNAEGAANLAATLATLQGVGRVEGNDIRSDLHYENGVVDFNGQKMTPEAFVQFMAAKVGRG
ncbi:YdgA family protein [Pseudomonas typographi]|uniref:YdgA family protein n=1 Tax=Pseudomonas typographi TaxID=2715964 RepID=UPI001684C2B3|nr:YdgA family protein [Pseudomonas typographi]MBD1550032.1 YdgA family protein [Pseudomonas typographi]